VSDNASIRRRRLFSQHISDASFETPHDVVAWLGAVQAQDYLGALWAVGLRMRNAIESDVEAALANRSIVRTWPLRGTLHFVAAEDVRWMLALLAPRVIDRHAGRLKKDYELDESVFRRSRKLFGTALEGGRQLSRDAMYQVLERARVPTAKQRGLQILWRLAHEGLICFAAREGRQQTFALLDEWIPMTNAISRAEGLAELATRYFTSRGPATLADFVWWSGLAPSEAKGALEGASDLEREVIDGTTYWASASAATVKSARAAAYLLPAFDEYTVAYKDRRAVLDAEFASDVNAGNGLKPVIIVDGKVAGTWKRTLTKDSVAVTSTLFKPLERAKQRAVEKAASRYGMFLQLPVES
jgi:hypothetical protein